MTGSLLNNQYRGLVICTLASSRRCRGNFDFFLQKLGGKLNRDEQNQVGVVKNQADRVMLGLYRYMDVSKK